MLWIRGTITIFFRFSGAFWPWSAAKWDLHTCTFGACIHESPDFGRPPIKVFFRILYFNFSILEDKCWKPTLKIRAIRQACVNHLESKPYVPIMSMSNAPKLQSPRRNELVTLCQTMYQVPNPPNIPKLRDTTYLHSQTFTCIYTHLHIVMIVVFIYVHFHLHTFIIIYVHTFTSTYIHMFTQIYIYTYMCKHMYLYKHIIYLYRYIY